MTIPGQEPGQVPNPNYPPPQYGAPQPGYPPQPGFPPPKQGTNKLAIWSLVTSLLGLLCGVGAIFGIVLGFMAIKQLNRSREGGRGLATAGIVIGILTLIVILPSTIALLQN